MEEIILLAYRPKHRSKCFCWQRCTHHSDNSIPPEPLCKLGRDQHIPNLALSIIQPRPQRLWTPLFSSNSTPLFGTYTSTPKDPAHVTLTLPGAAVRAVFFRTGSKHSVNRKGLRQFVPICDSKPWAVVLSAGGTITPALFVNTSGRVSFDVNSAADLEMVGRFARSRKRNSRRPCEWGRLL